MAAICCKLNNNLTQFYADELRRNKVQFLSADDLLKMNSDQLVPEDKNIQNFDRKYFSICMAMQPYKSEFVNYYRWTQLDALLL